MILNTLTTSDRVNLLELYARSVMLIELGRCTEWADLFVSHGSVNYENCPNRPLDRSFKGREQLLNLGREMIAGEYDVAVGYLSPAVACRRVLTDISLFAHGTRAALGFAHLTVTTIAGREPPRWIASGIYRDLLNKNASGYWLFQSRTFVPDGAALHAVTVNPSPALGVTATTP